MAVKCDISILEPNGNMTIKYIVLCKTNQFITGKLQELLFNIEFLYKV